MSENNAVSEKDRSLRMREVWVQELGGEVLG